MYISEQNCGGFDTYVTPETTCDVSVCIDMESIYMHILHPIHEIAYLMKWSRVLTIL